MKVGYCRALNTQRVNAFYPEEVSEKHRTGSQPCRCVPDVVWSLQVEVPSNSKTYTRKWSSEHPRNRCCFYLARPRMICFCIHQKGRQESKMSFMTVFFCMLQSPPAQVFPEQSLLLLLSPTYTAVHGGLHCPQQVSVHFFMHISSPLGHKPVHSIYWASAMARRTNTGRWTGDLDHIGFWFFFMS